MKKEFEKIIENELKFKELATKQFSEDKEVKRENVKNVLTERSLVIRKIINETNDLVAKYVTPFLKDPTKASKEEVLEYQEFAEKLSGYKESIDTGMSYDIRHALTEYAIHTNDDELYINNMFYKGLALFYLDRAIFKPEMSDCYAGVIAYSNRYEEFDRDIRNLIVRAYGNYYISVPDFDIDEIYRRYDMARNFWENTGKKFDPDFPWDAYLQNMHGNICSTTITMLRSKHRYKVKDEHKKKLLESAEYLYDLNMKEEDVQSNDYTSAQIKYIYYIQTARFYNNKISSAEFLDCLYDIYKQSKNEYTYDGLYKKLHISALYLYYLSENPPENLSKKDIISKSSALEKDVLKYIRNIPDNLSQAHVTTMISSFAFGSQFMHSDTTYLRMLLSMTVFRHLPTYVHSVMVAKISYTITEYLIKYIPDALVGLPGINCVEDVKSKSSEILKFVWYSGLIHDIGKIVYSHLVSFYVRRLNDKEFQMIKEHSYKAEDFIKPSHNFASAIYDTDHKNKAQSMRLTNNSGLFSCFSDVAYGHHKSYDGTFGYPSTFDNLASPVKVVIDIISIADSIDAATDNVGRSYAHEKKLSDMRDDLLSQINTRYNPTVTKAVFENQELYDAIDDILNEYRYDIYYSCFSAQDFSKTMLSPRKSTF